MTLSSVFNYLIGMRHSGNQQISLYKTLLQVICKHLKWKSGNKSFVRNHLEYEVLLLSSLLTLNIFYTFF